LGDLIVCNKELYKKTNQILSLLLMVANRPRSFADELIYDDSIIKNSINFSGEDIELLNEFYEFIRSKYSLPAFSNINHMDALLRIDSIHDFFTKKVGLQEAWILFVDTHGNVEQLWVKDRVNSVLFPEYDSHINYKRIDALQSENSFKSFLEKENERIKDLPRADIKKSVKTLEAFHRYRAIFAKYLIALNNEVASKQPTLKFSLSNIPALRFLGDVSSMAKRRPIEQTNFVLLSTPQEFINKKALPGRKEKPDFPFDDFILDAMLKYLKPTDVAKINHVFFSLPLGAVDTTETKDHEREHGAIWSGFIKVGQEELRWLDSEKSMKHKVTIPEILLWRINTTKFALNVFGHPCINKQLEKQLKESAKAEAVMNSHRLLLHIQRPLDELTKAFDKVQAEAQEMQAILNEPEAVLFKTHKLLAPLFQADHEIQIAKSVKLSCRHGYQYECSVKNSFRELQKVYCYMLCCIFGVVDDLKEVHSRVDLVKKTREVLQKVRELSVFENLLPVVEKVVLGKCWKEDIKLEQTLQKLNGESEKNKDDAGKRFAKAIAYLKSICFTPFKDTNDEWYKVPVYVAAFRDDFEWTNELIDRHNGFPTNNKLRSAHTPFAQHAILNFIIDLKAYFKDEKNTPNPIEKGKLFIYENKEAQSLEYYIGLRKKFFNPDEKEGISVQVLNKYLDGWARFGVAGRNMGNFLGIFQKLIRHGLGVVPESKAKQHDWALLNGKRGKKFETLMILGKKDGNGKNNYSRYFSIVQKEQTLCISWQADSKKIFELGDKPWTAIENER